MRSLDAPVLILHGTEDSLIPYEHALCLQAAAKRAELVSYRCDHNDCPPDWTVFFRDVSAFLSAHGLAGGS